jgi:hypothetical protein
VISIRRFGFKSVNKTLCDWQSFNTAFRPYYSLDLMTSREYLREHAAVLDT